MQNHRLKESQPVASDADRLIASVLFAWATEEMVEDQQRPHVERFAGVPGRVLEIGCGRGTMLQMLEAAEIEAYGLDTSDEALTACQAKGLAAVRADALEHLASLADGSLGGIFCAHVIEHFTPIDASRLILESLRVLKPGGRFVLVTPNARDLRVVERFWLDPTHVRPYPRKLLCVLMEKAGFGRITVSEDKEPAANLCVRAAKLFLRLWFMGFLFRGDLVVSARKPENS